MWGVIACGGDSGTASPGVDGTAEDGRILVANETEEALEVAYLREDEASGPPIVWTAAATQIELEMCVLS